MSWFVLRVHPFSTYAKSSKKINISYPLKRTRSLFWACFALKKIHNIAGATVQVIGFNTIFSLCTERSKCFDSDEVFPYLKLLNSAWIATAFLPFKRCYPGSYKNVFQMSLLNPIIGTSKTSPSSPSSVNSKCISDRIDLIFDNSGWYGILKTNLLLFLVHFCLFKTSKVKYFPTWKICPVTTLSL